MRKAILVIGLILLTQIYGCTDPCYNNHYLDITTYDISQNLSTTNGIKVDDPQRELDLAELDRQTTSLEECLRITVNRQCLIVKVAPDWYTSPCSGQQLFPCDIPISVCEDKGITLTEECPCNCRAIIQNENTIIVTPDLLLYRAELARMVTGVNNPWVPTLSHCLLD